MQREHHQGGQPGHRFYGNQYSHGGRGRDDNRFGGSEGRSRGGYESSHEQDRDDRGRFAGAPDKRADLWPEIRMQLLSHERGELREVYPVLRSMDATRALADHHDAEAKDMEDMILDLDQMPITSDAWMALFDQLADTVVQHAEEEEREIFPQAQAVLGAERTEELDAQFLKAKTQLAAVV